MSFFNEVAFPWVIGVEKGYSHDAADDGNWTGGRQGRGILKGTKYGVSAKAYPMLDIINLTIDDAAGIAKKDYWDVLRGDELPAGVSLAVFDHGYNSGVRHAVMLLQATLDVHIDGVVGDETLKAAGGADIKMLVYDYALTRVEDYTRDRTWTEDGKGWCLRAINTARKAVQA